jgi:hypothetical protein
VITAPKSAKNLCNFFSGTYTYQFSDPNDKRFAEKWEEFKSGQDDAYFLFGQNEFGMRTQFCGGDRARQWNKNFKEHPRRSHI